jgi:hypothetical protein
MSLMTPTGILSFPNLFVARAAVPGGEPRFSLNLIFNDEAIKTAEYQALRKAVAEAIDGEWGAGKASDAKFVGSLRLPFRKTSEKEYAGYDQGTVFVHAWTKQKPGLVDARLQDILVPDDVWAGQLARATVRPFAYQQSGNKGVSFALENVQIVKKAMPRLDGRVEAKKAFGAVEGDDPAPENDVPF